MLTEYGASGGVTFRVIKDGSRLNVVPAETGARAAQRVHQDSVLETNITIPRARRDGLQLLRAICDEIQRQTGYAIGIGPSAPVNGLVRFPHRGGNRRADRPDGPRTYFGRHYASGKHGVGSVL